MLWGLSIFPARFSQPDFLSQIMPSILAQTLNDIFS